MSVSELAQGLAMTGVGVTVYTTTANGKAELDVKAGSPYHIDGVEVIYFRRYTGDHSHFSPGLFFATWKTCRRYNVVHIQSWWNLVSILAVVACLLRGVRPVLSVRGMLSSYSFLHSNAGVKGMFHRLIGAFLLRRTVFHATSMNEQAECIMHVPGWKGFVLPNFVRLDGDADRPAHSPGDTMNIGFLSRVDRKKGLEPLMEALQGFPHPFVLHVAGDGDKAYISGLRELALRLAIDSNVRWLGWLDGNHKFDFLASLDLFALTSHNENFANVVVEALSVGTPVLVTSGVGLSSYVKEQRLGWVCEMQAQQIREALIDAYEQKDRRREIRGRAPGEASRTFSGIDLARKYIDKYQEFV